MVVQLHQAAGPGLRQVARLLEGALELARGDSGSDATLPMTVARALEQLAPEIDPDRRLPLTW